MQGIRGKGPHRYRPERTVECNSNIAFISHCIIGISLPNIPLPNVRIKTRSRSPPLSSTSSRRSGFGSWLSSWKWLRGGRSIQIPIIRDNGLTIPLIPLLLLLLAAGLFMVTLRPSSGPQIPPGMTHSPFRIDSHLFLDPPPINTPSYLPAPVSPKKKGMVVPNAVHYVYGLKPVKEGEQAEELPYYAYLAMRSALLNLQPEKMFFHYEHLPTGPWWNLIEPELTLIKTVVPDTYLGRPLKHFAHKADVLRLLAMKYSGGIYLDIDMFVVKSFDDLLYYPTTLGMQMSPHSEATALEPQGLCNAVILSAPHSTFIDRWLASYETFDDASWDHHSVEMSWELARRYPNEIQVLSNRAFFYPMWHGNEIEKTHEKDEHDFRAVGQYAYHAWESLAMKYLKNLSPKSIREENNSFNRLVRPYIGPKDDEVYAKWIKADGAES